MKLDVLQSKRADVQVLRDLANFGVELIGRYPAYRRAITDCIMNFGHTLDEMKQQRIEEGRRISVLEMQTFTEYFKRRLEETCQRQTESC